MSALFFRPVVTMPVRCAPAIIRPAFPQPHDVAPLFSFFDETFAQLERAARQHRRQFKRPFNPKFDVKERDNTYQLEGELPGFNAKDISIEFLDDGHTLQIKGSTVSERRSEQPTTSTNTQTDTPKAVEAVPAEKASETSSVKSHQATVEDDAEEQPANSSAADANVQTPQPQEQVVAESSKPAESQVSQPTNEGVTDATKHWVSERYTGSFTRSFKFPTKVDQEAVKASLKDGILAITLPFARRPESRRIQIE